MARKAALAAVGVYGYGHPVVSIVVSLGIVLVSWLQQHYCTPWLATVPHVKEEPLCATVTKSKEATGMCGGRTVQLNVLITDGGESFDLDLPEEEDVSIESAVVYTRFAVAGGENRPPCNCPS